MASKADPIDLDAAARLALVRKALELNQGQVAEICKVTTGWISHMEVGRRAIPFEVLKYLCLSKRVNPAYILVGESPMIMGQAERSSYEDLAAELEVLKAKVNKILGS